MEKAVAGHAKGCLDQASLSLEELKLRNVLPTEVEMKLGDGAVLKTSREADTKLDTPGRWMKQLRRWGLGHYGAGLKTPGGGRAGAGSQDTCGKAFDGTRVSITLNEVLEMESYFFRRAGLRGVGGGAPRLKLGLCIAGGDQAPDAQGPRRESGYHPELARIDGEPGSWRGSAQGWWERRLERS